MMVPGNYVQKQNSICHIEKRLKNTKSELKLPEMIVKFRSVCKGSTSRIWKSCKVLIGQKYRRLMINELRNEYVSLFRF